MLFSTTSFGFNLGGGTVMRETQQPRSDCIPWEEKLVAGCPVSQRTLRFRRNARSTNLDTWLETEYSIRQNKARPVESSIYFS